MCSETSKPSSDAGFKPFRYAAMLHARIARKNTCAVNFCAQSHHLQTLFTDKQEAFVLPCPSLTERHRAPTRGPACTHVHAGWGGNSGRQSVQLLAIQHSHGQTRFARCQVRLLRGFNPSARSVAGEFLNQPRGHVSLPEACSIRAVVALGEAVSQSTMQQHAFAWWCTPTQRAHRSQIPAPVQAPQRRPFSRSTTHSSTARPAAQVLQFKRGLQ